MTEDEAKTKWCPLSRPYVHTQDGPAPTRYVENGQLVHTGVSCCIGSKCMAWGVVGKNSGTCRLFQK
jgi:hypothetical protein